MLAGSAGTSALAVETQLNSTALLNSTEETCWSLAGSAAAALLEETLAVCQESFVAQTGGTGCCTSGNSSVLGKCDPCTGEFHCDMDATEAAGGSHWGVYVALVADVAISVGLLLQKVAHNRIARMHQALGEEEEGGDGGIDAQARRTERRCIECADIRRQAIRTAQVARDPCADAHPRVRLRSSGHGATGSATSVSERPTRCDSQ